VKVFWNVSYLLRYVQGWFRFRVRFCLDLVQGCVRIHLGFELEVDHVLDGAHLT
jgi:hypothetical protein